jgi:hypothetical protein
MLSNPAHTNLGSKAARGHVGMYCCRLDIKYGACQGSLPRY